MTTHRSAPAPRLVDASMHLLTEIRAESVDPDYARLSASGNSRRPGWIAAVALCVFGLMVGIAVAGTLRTQPAAVAERDQLVARVRAAAARQDALRAQMRDLSEANRALADSALGLSPDQATMISSLDTTTGMRAVRGPGVVLVVDDAAGNPEGGRVVDVDLRQAVNGLWQSGAEAIAINGHRLSAKSAIRGAGSAITVDYRSLTAPYRVEAVGQSRTLLAAFPATPGGRWWSVLRQTYDLRYELSAASELTLAPDPGLSIRYATPVK